MNVYPAILSDSLNEIQSQLAIAASAPSIKVVEIDVIDGSFADNLTISPADLAQAQLDFANLQLDFHLMVEEPLDYLYEIIDHQQQLPVRAVRFHVEKASSQLSLVKEAKEHNLLIGTALNLFTPLEVVEQAVLSQLDQVELLAIEAGSQGQVFQETVLPKIEQLQAYQTKTKQSLEIIVDGGVKLKQIELLARMKVDAVAIGSLLWKNDHPLNILQEIKSIVDSAAAKLSK